MSLVRKIINRICKVEWGCAIREAESYSLFTDNNNTLFVPIPNSFRYWAADPFLIDYDGKTMLFVELYDRFKRKGLIGYMNISSGIKKSFKVVYETNCHLSYPYVFEYNDNLYAIPESNNIKKLLLLRWNNNKEKFEEVRTFMEGYCLADTTFVLKDQECFMLTTEVTYKDNIGTLSIFKRTGNGLYEPSINNPIVKDKSSARNAGKVISINGFLYRISQDCSNGYGAGLNLMKIEKISLNEYKETLEKKIYPSNVSIKGINKIDGIHTYNANGKYEVIDYKISHKFSLGELIGYVLCQLRIYNKMEK